MKEENIDVLGVAESWTNDKILDAEIAISGYEMFRKDRMDKRGGGVLLYVKEGYTAVNVSDRTKGKCETVWVNIGDSKKGDSGRGML